MYCVRKDTGVINNVVLLNVETNAQVFLGGINNRMLEILGLIKDTPEEQRIQNYAEWQIDVDSDVAKELVATMIPYRDKQKANQNKPAVDALDVILGLAKY